MGAERALRGRVLVVDDEMHLRLFLKAVFESAGYETAMARDGEEGLARAREFKPDLVSLDLMMPNQGGVRFLSALRADPELAATKVLVVSAVESQTFQHSLSILEVGGMISSDQGLAGPDGYVEKPPTAQRLLREAERILGAAGSASAPGAA
jgi:CheY-like chemotaxis protein